MPWTKGPIYLADGEPKQPLGHSEVNYTLHGRTLRQSTAVLHSETLAFPCVLGMDFLFQSGMKLDISKNVYWFEVNNEERFQFLTEMATEQESAQHCAFFLYCSSLLPAFIN